MSGVPVAIHMMNTAVIISASNAAHARREHETFCQTHVADNACVEIEEKTPAQTQDVFAFFVILFAIFFVALIAGVFLSVRKK